MDFFFREPLPYKRIFPRQGLSEKSFPRQGLSKFIFYWRVPLNFFSWSWGYEMFFFRDFLCPQIINGRPLSSDLKCLLVLLFLSTSSR